MATYNTTNKRTRPNYGDRRTRGANTDILSESVQYEQSPREIDIILDTSRQEGNSITIGHPRSEHDRPSRLLGKVGHSQGIRVVSAAETVVYMDSLRGGPSRLAAQLLTGRNNVQLYHSAGDTLNGLSPMSAGMMFHDRVAMWHAFPCNDASLIQAGATNTDFVGAKALLHGVMNKSILNGTLANAIPYDNSSSSKVDTGLHRSIGGVAHPIIVDVVKANAQSVPHFLMTGISPRDGMARTSLFHTTNDMSKPYELYNATLHGDLARQAINTPDEYLLRNQDAIRDLIQRLPYFLKNDVVGSFQKGGRSGWWTRASEATLHIMGEMGHLGMSLRLGMPVQNCYAFSHAGSLTDPEHEVATGGTDDSTGGDSAIGNTIADFDDDGIFNDVTEYLEAENAAPINVVGYNASVSPFFIYFMDGSFDGSNDAAEKGIFMGGDVISCAICPGIIEDSPLMPEDRDPSTNDIVLGLNWVLGNCGSSMGAHWSSVTLPCMETFEDIKNGKVVDLAANSARTSTAALRSAFHMGLTTVDSVISGAKPPGNTADFGLFHGEGFIDQSVVSQFKDDMHDLGLRSYLLGPKFAHGQARHGDARSSVTHDYVATGALREVDVRLTPVAYGHWGIRPSLGYGNTAAVNTLTTPVTMTAWSAAALPANTVTAGNYMNTDSVWWEADITADAGNLLGLTAGANTDVALLNLKYLQYLGVCTNMGEYSTFDNALSWVGSREPGFDWDSYSGTLLANDRLHTLMMSPSGSHTVNNRLFDTEYVNFAPGNVFGRWCAEYDRLFKMVASTKAIEHYQAPIDLEQGTAINLAKELTNRTGDPALQRFLSGFIIAASQGYNSGAPVALAEIRNPYVLDRQLHNRDLHAPRGFRGDAIVDFLPMMLPSNIASEFAMVSGTHRVMLDRLGLVGEARESATFGIRAAQFRTIYDTYLEQAWTGEILSYSIGTGYNFELSQFGTVAGPAWRELVPHFNMPGRLITGLGNSVDALGVLGFRETAHANGSTVNTLTGYTTAIPATVIDDLQLVNPVDDTPLAPTAIFDLTTLENMLSTVKGSIINREYEASDFAFVFADMDMFNAESCRMAALRNEVDNVIPVGPIPLLLVYSKEGNLIQSSDAVDTASAVSSTPAPAPAEDAPTSEEVEETVTEVISDE